MSQDTRFDYLIGLRDAVAFELIQEDGFCPRVLKRDGAYMTVTKDLRMDRVNYVVENNLVTEWFIG